MVKTPCFFKIVFAGHPNDRLRIPSKFLKHISNELSGRATLEVRSGCSWNAKVSETSSGGVFIDDGWQQFLKDNSLGNNELLLLTYEGNMCFSIQIFEVNGLERLSLPSTSTEMLRGRPIKHPASTVLLNPTSNSCEDGSGKNFPCYESDKPKKFEAKKVNRRKIESKEVHPVHFPSKDDIARKLKAAESFKSKYPHFSSLVKRRHQLYLPKTFSKEHLPHKRTELVLRNLEGKSWVVNATPGHCGHYFYGGWYHFLDGNRLKRNDVCVFELVDRLEMRVHFFRLSERTRELKHVNSTM